MIITRHPERDLNLGSVPIRALRSLTKSHVDTVAEALGTLRTEWSLGVHDDYDGYLSIVISADDETSPVFVLSGTTDQIDLCSLDHGDRMLERGSFTTMEAATTELVELLNAAPPISA